MAKAKKAIAERTLRAEKIHSVPMRRIGPHLKNLSGPKRRGSPLSKSEKEIICHVFDKHLGRLLCVSDPWQKKQKYFWNLVVYF